MLNVVDLATFQTFLRLCAGRTGQLLNLNSLGADAGITHLTVREWLSVLEASFIVLRLQPFFRNLGKRLVKSPKLYFHDTWLLCFLLGIRSVEDLRLHYLRGAIFKNWVITEMIKARTNRGQTPDFFFYRDQAGHEIDLLIDSPLDPVLIKMKSGETPLLEFAKQLTLVGSILEGGPQKLRSLRKLVVYAGDKARTMNGVEFVPWREAGRIESGGAGV